MLMSNIDCYSSIWSSGCVSVNSLEVYLMFGVGLSLLIFVLVFVLVFIFFMSCVKDGFYGCFDNVDLSFEFNNLIYEEDSSGFFMFGGMIIELFNSFFVVVKNNLYLTFCYMFPMFSIFVYESGDNKISSWFYFESIGFYWNSFFVCGFQWGWDGFYDICYGNKILTCVLEYPFDLCWKDFLFGFNYGYNNKVLLKDLLECDNMIFVLSDGLLLVSSKDVIHSVFILDLGLKMDAIPGSVNSVIFEMIDSNFSHNFTILCSELCGVNHVFMSSEICILNEMDYYLFKGIEIEMKDFDLGVNMSNIEWDNGEIDDLFLLDDDVDVDILDHKEYDMEFLESSEVYNLSCYGLKSMHKVHKSVLKKTFSGDFKSSWSSYSECYMFFELWECLQVKEGYEKFSWHGLLKYLIEDEEDDFYIVSQMMNLMMPQWEIDEWESHGFKLVIAGPIMLDFKKWSFLGSDPVTFKKKFAISWSSFLSSVGIYEYTIWNMKEFKKFHIFEILEENLYFYNLLKPMFSCLSYSCGLDYVFLKKFSHFKSIKSSLMEFKFKSKKFKGKSINKCFKKNS